ncbi:MAG TPA: SRPBCC domain-containing protein [Acidobacteriota bacterium]|nr:SRPBCC domain-containing protein [Acidobacteriota bacterium]
MKEKTVDIKIVIGQDPQIVFRALTDPEIVKLWWRSPDFYEVMQFQMEPYKGGRWKMNALGYDGKPFDVSGEVLEFDPPRTLAFTWNPTFQDIDTTTVRITLSSTSEGVLLRLVHSGFKHDRLGFESHYYGWPHVLNWLANHLQS